MKEEFKLLANVFKLYLPPEYPYDVVGGQKNIKQADFDDKVNPNNARLDAIKLYDAFIGKGINPKNIKIYFSGKKGFHVELDYRSYMDKPIHELHLIYKMFYLINKDDLLTLDKTIYSIRKQWRVVNTRHSGSGLFCIQISREEF
jgi:hypothetical protein